MNCERYRQWIEDAAAEIPGAAQRPDLRELELKAHLAVCSRCRAALEREQSLVAAMDRGLAMSLVAEPSPAFAAGVRARLSESQVRPRGWLAGWAPVAAGALAASVVLGVSLARRHKAASGRQEGIVSVTRRPKQEPGPRSEESANTRLESPVRPGRAEVRGQKTERRYRMQAASQRRSNAGPDVEVLVPKGQAAAVMQLYNSVWNSHQELAAVVAKDPDGASERAPVSSGLAPKPLEIKPLETPALDAELKPLAAPDEAPVLEDR